MPEEIGLISGLFALCASWLVFATHIPFTLCILLTVDKKGMQMVLKSFQFWIILWNYIIASGCVLYVSRNFKWYDILLTVFQWCVYGLLLIMAVSMLDGLHFRMLLKKMVVVMMLVFFVSKDIFITFQMFNGGNIDHSVIHISKKYGLSISIYSTLIGSMRVIEMYLLKQCVSLFIKKERCGLIRYAPYIKWLNGSDQISVNTTQQIKLCSTMNRMEDNNEIEEDALNATTDEDIP